MLPRLRFCLLLIAVVLLAGCSGAKETATEPAAEPAAIDAMMATTAQHPLAGAWEYSIDTPQGVFTGTITFAEAGGTLSGTIAQSQQPDQTAPLDELMFDKEASKVTFTFDSGEYGMMLVNLTLDGDAFSGLMTVTQFGADVPMTGSRKTME